MDDKVNDAHDNTAIAPDEPARQVARKTVGRTRFIAGIPALGLFVCSIALNIVVLVNIGKAIVELCGGHLDSMTFVIECVEYADQFLLGVALYILSLGLVSLFITDKIPLPHWLEFHDFDDLKERLIGVIVVMLGVYFLGEVLKGDSAYDLLLLGIAIAVAILALTFFVSKVFLGHGKR